MRKVLVERASTELLREDQVPGDILNVLGDETVAIVTLQKTDGSLVRFSKVNKVAEVTEQDVILR